MRAALPKCCSNATRMPVRQVQHTMQVEKNHVYVISPSNDLALDDGHLLATEADRPRGRPIAIDLFFRSLAETHRDRAIADHSVGNRRRWRDRDPAASRNTVA